LGLFTSRSAQAAIEAIRSAYPGFDVEAEVRKLFRGTKALCVVIQGREQPIDADQAGDVARRAWEIARDNTTEENVLVSVIDAKDGESLVDELGRLSRP
jgi:hypothetical protein